MPNFLHIFKFLGLIILSLAGCNSAKSQKKNSTFTVEKPNVIIIYADQLRLYSAGFWSEPEYREDVIGKPDPVVTPTIDKLAKNGVVLTRAVVNYP